MVGAVLAALLGAHVARPGRLASQDSLEIDVLATQRCGLQTLWSTRRGERPEPETPAPKVTSLHQRVGLAIDGP